MTGHGRLGCAYKLCEYEYPSVMLKNMTFKLGAKPMSNGKHLPHYAEKYFNITEDI